MLARFQILKYFFCVTALIIFSGCASFAQKNDYRVYTANVEWVKLYPNEMFQEDCWKKNAKKGPDGLEEITVSNNCGKAEIQYKTKKNSRLHVWMNMGEWCHNPFDDVSDRQVIVISWDNNQLLEYYPIEKTQTMGDVILLLEKYQLMNSIFSDLVKPFTEPLFLFHKSKANDGWIEMMVEEGLIEKRDDEIWILKGIYLSDIIQNYKL